MNRTESESSSNPEMIRPTREQARAAIQNVKDALTVEKTQREQASRGWTPGLEYAAIGGERMYQPGVIVDGNGTPQLIRVENSTHSVIEE